jgi:hypothetical protein
VDELRGEAWEAKFALEGKTVGGRGKAIVRLVAGEGTQGDASGDVGEGM